jgi:hypothetical protein
MKFTRISLEHCGFFHSMTVRSLSPGLNVILGETGSGKSTLRHALGAAFFGFKRVPEALLGVKDRPGSLSSDRRHATVRIAGNVQGSAFELSCDERVRIEPAVAGAESVYHGGIQLKPADLGSMSPADYYTFFNVSFVDAPEIERRMVKRLTDHWGVTRHDSKWSTESEHRAWREAALARRERLAHDEQAYDRLVARRDRLRTDLSAAELQHRQRLAELEQRRDRARSHWMGLETERTTISNRIRELERLVAELETRIGNTPQPTKVASRPASFQVLHDWYQELDRVQREMRRSSGVRRDVQRRLQKLQRQRLRLTERPDLLDQPGIGATRLLFSRLELVVQRLSEKHGEKIDARDVFATLAGFPERQSDPAIAPWSVDGLGWRETLGREGELEAWTTQLVEFWLENRWVGEGNEHRLESDSLLNRPWQHLHLELQRVKRLVWESLNSEQEERFAAEERDQRRCEHELRVRISGLKRRRARLLALLKAWDVRGYELIRQADPQFVRRARLHGYWEARRHFIGDMPETTTTLQSPDPDLIAKLDAHRAELQRIRPRFTELDGRVGEARTEWENLEHEYQQWRERVSLGSLRRELEDVMMEIGHLESRLLALRDEVRRDEPWLHQPFDGVTERASDWCRRLTRGRWRRVGVDDKEQRLFAVDEASGVHTFSGLNRETQDKVCLAFCLAVAENMAANRTPWPLVLDDLMVNFDASEGQTVLDTLWDFVKTGHQVFLLASERQWSPRWLDQPRQFGDWAEKSAVYQLPSGDSHEHRSQASIVLDPLGSRREKPVETVTEPKSQWAWPLISEQTPLSHLDLIEPEWLLVLSQHRILTIGDLLDLNSEEMPPALRRHGITVGQMDRWQSMVWLLCCIPGSRPYDVRLLVGSGINEPEQLEELSAGDVLRKLEIFLATEDGQRVMNSGSAEERSRLHAWMNNLRDNRRAWPTREHGHWTNRKRRFRRPGNRLGDQGGEPSARVTNPAAVTMRIHGDTPDVDDAGSSERLIFHLDLDDDVERAPSIGPRMAERLAEIGIKTVRSFLGASAEKMTQQLKLRRVDLKTLSDWQSQATLVCQVPNLRGHDAQLLVACEITSPEQILLHSPKELLAKVTPFAESKEGQRILRSSPEPDLAEVEDWIRWARQFRTLQVA